VVGTYFSENEGQLDLRTKNSYKSIKAALYQIYRIILIINDSPVAVGVGGVVVECAASLIT
jgi:hypothetical protein